MEHRGFNLKWSEKPFGPVPASWVPFPTPCTFLSDPPDGRSMKSPLERAVGLWTDVFDQLFLVCAGGTSARRAGRSGV